MSGFDLHANITVRISLTFDFQVTPSLVPGEIIDTLGFESVEFVVISGGLDSGGFFQIFLEQGDDAGLSDATVLPADETLGDLPQFTEEDDNVTIRVGSIGKKRYQRLSLDAIVGSIFGNIGAIAILSHPHTAPTP